MKRESRSLLKIWIITKRLNNNIIKEYMIRLGIDINTIDAQIKAGIVYVRKKW